MVVRSGIETGDKVIVSDLLPAIKGMLLRVTRDDAMEAEIRRQLSDNAQ